MKKTALSLSFVTVLSAVAISSSALEVRAQEAAAPAAAVAGPKWEYRALRIADGRTSTREADVRARKSASQDTLNQLGADGWELVAVRNDKGNEAVFYFKRLKK